MGVAEFWGFFLISKFGLACPLEFDTGFFILFSPILRWLRSHLCNWQSFSKRPQMTPPQGLCSSVAFATYFVPAEFLLFVLLIYAKPFCKHTGHLLVFIEHTQDDLVHCSCRTEELWDHLGVGRKSSTTWTEKSCTYQRSVFFTIQPYNYWDSCPCLRLGCCR